VADTYIDNNKADTNLSTERTLKVRPNNDADLRGLLLFDLSDIPAHAEITSARLYLYEQDEKMEQVTYVYRVTSAWTESGATWNSPWVLPGGDFASSPAYATFVPGQRDCSISLNLTGLVQDWVDGTYPNYGVLLYSTGDSHVINYSSKEESGHSEQTPRLDVSYSIGTFARAPQPGLLPQLVTWLRSVFVGPRYPG
jgi:hypothetical protein